MCAHGSAEIMCVCGIEVTASAVTMDCGNGSIAKSVFRSLHLAPGRKAMYTFPAVKNCKRHTQCC